MPLTATQQKQLEEKLDPGRVKSRSQAGRSLSYLEGWDVVEKANEIFGHAGWSGSLTSLKHVGTVPWKSSSGKDGHKVAYIATFRVKVREGEYEDTGYGQDISYSSELEAHELASKEAATDAMKRALRFLGNQFGLCLYDKEQTGVGEGPDSRYSQKGEAKKSTAKKTTKASAKADMVDIDSLTAAQRAAVEKAGYSGRVAADKRTEELYAVLKDAGKEGDYISNFFANIAKKYGFMPEEWVEKQLTKFTIEKGD